MFLIFASRIVRKMDSYLCKILIDSQSTIGRDYQSVSSGTEENAPEMIGDALWRLTTHVVKERQTQCGEQDLAQSCKERGRASQRCSVAGFGLEQSIGQWRRIEIR